MGETKESFIYNKAEKYKNQKNKQENQKWRGVESSN